MPRSGETEEHSRFPPFRICSFPSAEISGAVRPVSSTLPWPDKLPETGPDPTALSARFGRANKKREDQIAAILETLRGLGL